MNIPPSAQCGCANGSRDETANDETLVQMAVAMPGNKGLASSSSALVGIARALYRSAAGRETDPERFRGARAIHALAEMVETLGEKYGERMSAWTGDDFHAEVDEETGC